MHVFLINTIELYWWIHIPTLVDCLMAWSKIKMAFKVSSRYHQGIIPWRYLDDTLMIPSRYHQGIIKVSSRYRQGIPMLRSRYDTGMIPWTYLERTLNVPWPWRDHTLKITGWYLDDTLTDSRYGHVIIPVSSRYPHGKFRPKKKVFLENFFFSFKVSSRYHWT